MKRVFLLLMITAGFAACRKHPVTPIPPMQYTNFHDSIIRYNQAFDIDLNNDGVKDFFFTVSIVSNGQGDHYQYRIVSSGNNQLLLNMADEPMLHSPNATIGKNGAAGYKWLPTPSGLIIEKVISARPDYRQGSLKDKQHRCLAVCVIKNGEKYYGWFNISHTNNKVIVHDAALCKVANADIVACK